MLVTQQEFQLYPSFKVINLNIILKSLCFEGSNIQDYTIICLYLYSINRIVFVYLGSNSQTTNPILPTNTFHNFPTRLSPLTRTVTTNVRQNTTPEFRSQLGDVSFLMKRYSYIFLYALPSIIFIKLTLYHVVLFCIILGTNLPLIQTNSSATNHVLGTNFLATFPTRLSPVTHLQTSLPSLHRTSNHPPYVSTKSTGRVSVMPHQQTTVDTSASTIEFLRSPNSRNSDG